MKRGVVPPLSTTAARVAVLLAFFAVLLLAFFFDARPAHAADFIVTSTADTGGSTCGATCTLRQAINAANAAPTDDTISFNITTGASTVKTISPGSLLPAITDKVTIDGYTQPGASENTATTNANNAVLKIELSGASAPSNAFGLAVSGDGATGTTIKGLVINRFGDDGVFVNAPNTTIEGNFIGTNAAGTADLGNGADGVTLLSSGNVVGGPANAAQNVISGNDANGVAVKQSNATGNTISNNHIGTDADAGEDLGNSESGVFVENAPDNTIGGSTDGELNIISGNNEHGVEILGLDSSGAKVLGNLIGVNLNGNGFSNIGNTQDGVRVSSVPQTEIGGTTGTTPDGPCTGACNVISDNGRHGVEISGSSATDNKVQGNRIGTNINGSADFGNTLDGVRIGNDASNTTVGGTDADDGAVDGVVKARNVISGNEANGVFISGTDSPTLNKIGGNFIGTDLRGISDLGNTEVGVRIETQSNSVGGDEPGAGNVISGNGDAGVSILATDVSSARFNKVEGNFIGTNKDGTSTPNNLGNLHGVFISGAAGTRVGGSFSETANTISGNVNDGVVIIGASATSNRILRNSIFENGQLGIDLRNNGVTRNDKRDRDDGPNLLQNFPVLTSASPTEIKGKLNSRPSSTFTIQLFSNPVPSSSTGRAEGKTFLDEISVTTDQDGKASFTFTPPAALSVGQVITATATDTNGNTSEFSAGRAVQ